MAVSDVLYVGIRGAVVAIDRATGVELWRRSLKGRDLVNVLVDGDGIYASARGEVFRLDPATGTLLWNNPLKGLGWGLSTLATSSVSTGNSISIASQKRKQEAAAAAAAS